MLALIAAAIVLLAAFGVDLGRVNELYLALAFFFAHFAFAIAVPWPRRTV
jgi:hypothetical protein